MIFLLLKCELLKINFFVDRIDSRLKNVERKKGECIRMSAEITQTEAEGRRRGWVSAGLRIEVW